MLADHLRAMVVRAARVVNGARYSLTNAIRDQ
jgi:hypothetical protein